MLNLNCVICSELFVEADIVYTTTCGHMFHFVCLTEWLDRSKSCPQCRKSCTERNISRLYFNLDTADVGSLQEQLDNVKLQLEMKEQELHKAEEWNMTLTDTQEKCMKTINGLEEKLKAADVMNKSYSDGCEMIQIRLKAINDQLELITASVAATSDETAIILDTEFDPIKWSKMLAAVRRVLNPSEEKNLRKVPERMKEYEERILQLESENYQLNEKFTMMQIELKAAAQHREEVKSLKDEIATMESIRAILTATSDEAAIILDSEFDPIKLSKMLAAVRRVWLLTEEKNKQICNALKVEQDNLRKEIERKKELEECILQLDSENYQLNEKFTMMQIELKAAAQLREEVKSLKDEIATMESIRAILTATSDEAAIILDSEFDPIKLSKMLAAVRRVWLLTEEKNKQICNALKVEQDNLRKEIERKKEHEECILQLDNENYQLNEKLTMMQIELKAAAQHREEVKSLKDEIATMESIRAILTATSDEAAIILDTEFDPIKLSKMLAAVRRELLLTVEKNTQIFNALKVEQDNLRKEIERKKEHKERILQLESENYQLNEKIKALETAAAAKPSSSNSLRDLLSSHIGEEKRHTIAPMTAKAIKNIEESNSPYLKRKRCST